MTITVVVILLLLPPFATALTPVKSPDFEIGDASFKGKTVVYRLIGNDMPPLQQRGQLRWNTKYALDNEPHFHGVTKRWILNRVWNETDYQGIYSDLLGAGVNRRDIVNNCFDLEQYKSYETVEDKMFYLTAQNEGRNVGITDGKDSGFEWIVILDGNTFITKDSWAAIEKALKAAKSKGKKYMKIPYHRVHSEQDTSWLNKTTTLNTLLQFAPVKGESQMAFHRDAEEMFTLGDTKPEQKDPKKRKGYGARNKSYMFKEGALCGPENDKKCQCASVVEGNEEDMKKATTKPDTKYAKDCGVVLRLWTYPTDEAGVETGLDKDDEHGFWCYVEDVQKADAAKSDAKPKTLCTTVKDAAAKWKDKSDSDKKKYRQGDGDAAADACKARYDNLFLTESCVRAADREIAQARVGAAVDQMIADNYKSSSSLCFKANSAAKTKKTTHYLTVMDEKTLDEEAKAYNDAKHKMHKAIEPYIKNLVAKADKGLKLGPYSVVDKTRSIRNEDDKRYYYSVRPYYWPFDLVEPEKLEELKKYTCETKHECKEVENNFVHRDGMRVPGSIIAGPGEEYNDRASAWYLVDNVTTLALAWKFTDDMKYATHAAKLVDAYFLDEKTGMHPNLKYAQEGSRLGLIDWKDAYFLLDAITLLQRAGALSETQVVAMQHWCAQLAMWEMTSKQGNEEVTSTNNHGMYFDMSTLALANYGNDMDVVDYARSRLRFRLTHLFPDGHFAYDGSQPHETARPTALHYITFNLIGWIHCAQIVESLRQHSVLPGSFPSLWWLRHENDSSTAPPVLLKAARWFVKYLPPNADLYTKWVEPKDGMEVKFPYEQDDHFAFDRMLEVVHYMVRVYGVKKVFVSDKDRASKPVQTALNYPFYSVKTAMMTPYTSTDPDSGGRVWPRVGVINHFFEGDNKWYPDDKSSGKRRARRRQLRHRR